MKEEHFPPEQTDPGRSGFRLLERVTAGVLSAVVVALAWMLVVAYQPGCLRLPRPEIEVMIVLALLGAALVLVSMVALLDTRR
jgi:hypothetical protein